MLEPCQDGFSLIILETVVANTGKVGVIVQHGVLFRSTSEGNIRKQLIEDNQLDAVVGLPSNLFYGTGVVSQRVCL